MDEYNLEIEDIVANTKKVKKKVDGKAKGNRTELQLCKLLTAHFGEEFSKAPGSGARWSQVNFLPEHAKKTLSGDVCVPEGFKWVIESKGGYEKDIDLNAICDGKGILRLDEFMEQSTRDANYSGRQPMVCWKRSRRPWLVMIKEKDLGPYKKDDFPYHIQYCDWIILSLEEFLNKTEKKYWFNEKVSK